MLADESLDLVICYLSLAFEVDLVSEDNEGEFLRLSWSSLIDELFLPHLQILEALHKLMVTFALVIS